MMDSFVAGFAYGATTVVVGQPLDTIKTRMQVLGTKSSFETMKAIFNQEGVRGLYRGGTALIIGGSVIRSTQFGVYEYFLAKQRSIWGATTKEEKMLGYFDSQVLIAGFAGGVGRGLVEGPFEYVKTRKQVNCQWRASEVFSGSTATILRNSFLFCSFVVYMDIGSQIVPGGLSPFWSGALCSNMAWLTVWPMDVVKSQMQSGLFANRSIAWLVHHNLTTGTFYQGLLPGLMRSFVANGCSMVVYRKVITLLGEREKTKS